MSEETAIVQVSQIVAPFRKLGYLLKAARFAAGSTGHAAMLSGTPILAGVAKSAELGLGFAELLVEGIDYNQKAKREANAATLLNLWQNRVEERARRLEALEEKDLDLFEHVVKKALEDDESRKMPFYNAVLSWVQTGNQGATRVKILADAVRTLTFIELYAFYVMVQHGRKAPTLPLFLTKELFKLRIETTGLGRTGSTSANTEPTELGNILHQFAKEEPLEEPPEFHHGTH